MNKLSLQKVSLFVVATALVAAPFVVIAQTATCPDGSAPVYTILGPVCGSTDVGGSTGGSTTGGGTGTTTGGGTGGTTTGGGTGGGGGTTTAPPSTVSCSTANCVQQTFISACESAFGSQASACMSSGKLFDSQGNPQACTYSNPTLAFNCGEPHSANGYCLNIPSDPPGCVPALSELEVSSRLGTTINVDLFGTGGGSGGSTGGGTGGSIGGVLGGNAAGPGSPAATAATAAGTLAVKIELQQFVQELTDILNQLSSAGSSANASMVSSFSSQIGTISQAIGGISLGGGTTSAAGLGAISTTGTGNNVVSIPHYWVSPAATNPVMVTANVSVLNIRSAPSISASIVGTLPQGQAISVVGFMAGDTVEGSNAWWKTSQGTYVWAGGTLQQPAP